MIGEAHIDHGVTASLIAAFVSTAAIISMYALGDWGRRRSSYFSAFAIGVLLVAVMFHLIPESISHSRSNWRYIAAGFLGMSLVGIGLRAFTSRRDLSTEIAFGYASLIALGFHSYIDGLIYGSTFHDEYFTGVLATAGLLLHEFPEGVIAYLLIFEAGASRLRAAIAAFLSASVTTVFGALTAATTIDAAFHDRDFGPVLGLAAGVLVYIMAFHLGPHARLTPHRRGYLVSMLGVSISLAAVVLRSVTQVHAH